MKKEKEGLDASRILQELMKTPLADVVRVMESREFSLPPEDAVKKGEVVIGEFTVFEKALVTVRNRLAIAANLIAETNSKMIEREGCFVGLKKAEKFLKNETAHRVASVTIEALDSLFLSSILNRLGGDLADDDSVRIRKGYQVVRSPHKKKDLNIHLISVE